MCVVLPLFPSKETLDLLLQGQGNNDSRRDGWAWWDRAFLQHNRNISMPLHILPSCLDEDSGLGFNSPNDRTNLSYRCYENFGTPLHLCIHYWNYSDIQIQSKMGD